MADPEPDAAAIARRIATSPRLVDKAMNLLLAEGMNEKNVARGLENLKMICEAG